MAPEDRCIPRVEGLFHAPVTLQALLDEIPMGIAILDDGLHVTLLNRSLCAVTGFSQETAATYRIPCHHVLRSRACVTACPARGMTADTNPVSVDTDIINRERQRIPVRVTVAPIAGDGEDPLGFIETVEDLRPYGEMDARSSQAYSFGTIIGKSPSMEKVFSVLPAVAQSDSSVLITGETGTGKDLVAEAIHGASGRAKGPFIKVNCGALPETLLESELFGHRKGAFTGAVENKPGRFQLAHNGTLFLTEIGDLPPTLQVKLLTFLDDQVVYPLGSTRGFQADVRVIAGTHRDLETMVHEKRFREDLLFRLNVVRVKLPPLRDRELDIRLLLDHFLNRFAGKFNKAVEGYSREALTLLNQYDYPGNVRELRNIVEYAVNICRESRILPAHLPAYLTEPRPVPAGEAGGDRPPAGERPRLTGAEGSGGTETWAEVERRMILDALVRAGGKRSRAAEILGWGRSTLWRKMKRHGIDSP